MSEFFSGPGIALFVREAWKNVAAAPVLTIVAVLTISVSLIMVGLFGFAMVNGNRLLDSAVEDLSITIYLDEAVTQEELGFLMDKIESRPEVQKATFFSRQEDLERNLKLLDRSLIEGLDKAVIPAQPSIEVNLKSGDLRKGDFTSLPEWLKEMEGVQSVQELYFDAEKLRILFALIDLIRVIGFIICTIVLAAAVFFIFSTIKLAVYARQDEIEVLRLVGATDRFIRAPFYIEGAFAGLLGSGVALLIISIIHSKLETFVKEEQFMNFDLHLMPAGMLIWLMAGGVILGLLGSGLSVGRYLRR